MVRKAYILFLNEANHSGDFVPHSLNPHLVQLPQGSTHMHTHITAEVEPAMNDTCTQQHGSYFFSLRSCKPKQEFNALQLYYWEIKETSFWQHLQCKYSDHSQIQRCTEDMQITVAEKYLRCECLRLFQREYVLHVLATSLYNTHLYKQ